jgi:hypothetical protein
MMKQTRAPLVPIPVEDLPNMINRPIHLAWADPGCVWILVSVEGEKMTLRTPKTGRVRVSPVKDACYSRYWEQRRAPSAPAQPRAGVENSTA